VTPSFRVLPARPSGPFLAAAAALAFIFAPLVFDTAVVLTVLAQAGTLAVIMLAFNLLYGQTGLMSFGHAVYAGMGGLVAAHAMQLTVALGWGLPLPLVPLAGGLGGLATALVFGYVSTRLAGTGFAMITLAIGELALAVAAILPGFFGGEAGLRVDRTLLPTWFGIDFGAQRAVVMLIAVWTVACAVALWAVTRTPLGLLAAAVRDNPARVAMLGTDPAGVRYRVMLIAGFFAGLGGALAVLHFEIANQESLASARSGAVLLFTFIGGAGHFFGPVLGALLHALALTVLAGLTRAWLLYLGLFFLIVVLFTPRGAAGVIDDLLHARCPGWGRPAPWLALTGGGTAAVLLIEMAYRLRFADSAPLVLAGWPIDVTTPLPWLVCAAVLLAALLWAWRDGMVRRARGAAA